MILLNSLPDDCRVVKNALQYTGIIPKLELVISGNKARELELHASKRNGNNLFVKGKTNRKETVNNFVQTGNFGSKDKQKGKRGSQKQTSGNVIIVKKRVILKNIAMII